MYRDLVSKSMEHNDEISNIWRNYNKELTGSDFIGPNIYAGIIIHQPNLQGEIRKYLRELEEDGYWQI